MVAVYLLIFIVFLSIAAEENTQLLCDLDTGEWCGLNQLCTSGIGESGQRIGICLCAQGYHRQNESKECFANEGEDTLKVPSSYKIELKIVGPNTVQLPQKEVELKTEVQNGTGGKYDYHWELIGGTGRADAASYNEPFLKLVNLNEGQLVYRVNVKNTTHEGFDSFNFTILPVKRPNSAPKAIIRPKSPVLGTEGSQIVLDAEGSTDDDRIVSYNWYQDQGPSVTLPAMNTAVLKLETLVPGDYLFSVVVTDTGGLTGNASVVVKVSAERDDPPKSRITLCGTTDTGSIYVRLPQEQLLLCGNSSTDDKGIETYSWFRVDNFAGKLPVDVAGSSSSVLVLTNIQENQHLGPYEFQLDVTDTKGQKDSSKILIFVNKAANMVPEVDAGGNQTVILPQSSFILNGNVKDDGSIVSYQWEQLQGPSTAVFSNGNQPKATVTGLEEGVYAFRLNVTDDGGLSAFSVAWISVERGKNEPPMARAPNVTVFLPHNVAVFNASSSSDDAGIVSYKWVPFDEVPAVMTALDGSENRAVMYVTGLVKGVHTYTLTVADQQKATNSVVVSLTVEQGNEDLESVELISTLYPEDVSFRLRTKLEARISSVLASSIKEISSAAVTITTVEKIPLDGRLRIVFFATAPELASSRMKRDTNILPGGVIAADKVVDILRNDANMHEDFHIVAIQPLYCKLTCSDHGYCSNISKECICDNFWMTSMVTLLTRGGHYDCAWSSLYFWLLLLAGIIATVVCCIRRRFMFAPVRRRRLTRRAKYTSLKSDSDQDVEIQRIRRAPRLKPLPFPPSSDSLESEDELLVPNSWEMEVRNRTGGGGESEKT